MIPPSDEPNRKLAKSPAAAMPLGDATRNSGTKAGSAPILLYLGYCGCIVTVRYASQLARRTKHAVNGGISIINAPWADMENNPPTDKATLSTPIQAGSADCEPAASASRCFCRPLHGLASGGLSATQL